MRTAGVKTTSKRGEYFSSSTLFRAWWRALKSLSGALLRAFLALFVCSQPCPPRHDHTLVDMVMCSWSTHSWTMHSLPMLADIAHVFHSTLNQVPVWLVGSFFFDFLNAKKNQCHTEKRLAGKVGRNPSPEHTKDLQTTLTNTSPGLSHLDCFHGHLCAFVPSVP